MSSFRRAAALALVLSIASDAMAETTLLDWPDLDGWAEDDHASALKAFQVTCGDLDFGDWPGICAVGRNAGNAKTFFETFFRPVLVEDDNEPLFTGYFEPELMGSLTPSDTYRYPLRRLPEVSELERPWLTREEIETADHEESKGLEIVWVSDPVEKFFLQVQGSGRIRLDDGTVLRVGYAGKNGHPYRSIGEELIRRGEFEPHQVSASVIRKWVRSNPKKGRELLWHNPSYVFFRELDRLPVESGPLGAMNRPITAGRTLAVDPTFVPLGAPVWIEKAGRRPLHRLMVAQDTGSAIKGAQRADIFYGSGATAGRRAGRVRDPGRMIILFPIDEALRRVGGE